MENNKQIKTTPLPDDTTPILQDALNRFLDSASTKDCIELLRELLPKYIKFHLDCDDQRSRELLYWPLRMQLVELREKSKVDLPPVPSELLGVEDWLTDVERALK